MDLDHSFQAPPTVNWLRWRKPRDPGSGLSCLVLCKVFNVSEGSVKGMSTLHRHRQKWRNLPMPRAA